MVTDLECFDPDYEGLFSRLTLSVARGIAPTDQELMVVFKWKLGRTTQVAADAVSANGDAIRKALLAADRHPRPAMTSLVNISQIGLAVASALLTACYVDRYTVFDRRVLEQLHVEGVAADLISDN